MSADVARQPIVASRVLMLDGQNSLTITIRQPYKSGDDYACECEIVGLADARVRTVMGVDSLQALLIAVVALQKQLEPYLNRLSWVTSDEGDIGLPHVMVFRNPLNDRLCQVLDVVLLRHEAQLAQKVAGQRISRFPGDVIEEANRIIAEVDSSAAE